MNSMHNSFGGSAPGGYGSPYPGYVPPTALPYYNGYPPDLSQGPSSYYGKPAIPGYSAGMSSYPSAAGINNSMYYQQYGLGYQYGYSKYGLSPGLPSGLGYGGDISNPGNITPSTLGGMQAPSNDLGLTGSMFSKSSSSAVAHTTASSSVSSTVAVTSISNCSNSKYSSASSNSPHLPSSQPNMMPSLAPSAPSSPNIHSQSSAIHGGIATSSPPVDSGDTKKDLDKMKRCQICGQVFRLMSECLAHMKAAHETLMPMYNIPGHGNHNNQGMLSHHMPPQTPARPTSTASDSPLMALERMGWGKEQSMTPGIHSTAPHGAGYPPHVPQMPPHLPDARYGEPSPHSAKRLNDYYNSCSSSSSPMNQEAGYSMERQSPSVPHAAAPSSARPRKSSSYSVSSIIGESNDSRSDQASTQENSSNQSSGLPPCLTPNLPVTSVASLPPNLSPNPPSGLHHSSTGTALAQQPPQLTPNLPNSVTTSQLPELSPHCPSESEVAHDNSSLEKQQTPETDSKPIESSVDKDSENENPSIGTSNENINALSNESKCNQESEVHLSNDVQPNEDHKKHSHPNEMTESVSSSGFEDGQVNKLPTDNEEDISSSDTVSKVQSADSNEEETVCDASKSNTEEAAPTQEEEIGDEDEPGDPSHPLHDQTPPSQSPSQTQVWTNLPSSTPPNTSPKAISLPTPPQSVQEQSPQPQPSPHPPPTPTPQSDTPSPSIHPQSFYPHPKNRMSPMSPHEFNDKQMHQHTTLMKSNPQHTPYQGAWPQGYVPSGASPTGYQYHQYPMHPGQSMGSNSNKMHGGYPPSRYPNQYPGYDSRRQMHSSYGPGHWYPPGRSDSKPPWVSWGSHQGHPYSHQYYYGNNGGPPHMPQHSPMGHKYPASHPVQAPSAPQQISSPSLASPIKSTPEETPSQAVEEKVKEVDNKPIRKGDRQKAKRGRAGPKSRVERKHLPVPKVDSVPPSDIDKGIEKDFDSSIYTLTPMHQNGNLSSVSISPGDANSNLLDSDAMENDENDQPKLAILKPAKKRKSTDGSFIGPKRIKIAKKVRQRQQCRQKLLQDQIKQSELEEQLTQQWVERAAEEEGPLANVLLKSSLLLGDNNVQEQDIMEDSIASITAELFQSSSNEELDGSGYNQSIASTSPNSAGGKKAGRKAGVSKVLHNSKSVMVKSKGKTKNTPPKLRAKDFKWSHYIKTMRFWCKDCGHGFKNQKDSQSHSEEQCKWNCLYLLECYVSVKDIVQHKTYGEKVEELLEEYQVDAEHKCNKCGTIVSRKADFLVHVDTHKDFMPWECTICGTRFKIRGSLKEHLRYTHMKGRVPCLKCNKVFATSTQLRQHVKVHTQHYKYTRVGKNREEDLRVAREAEEHEETPLPVPEEEHISSDQLSHEANEYRNWCKLMELNAMKNIATNDSGKNEEEEEDDLMESEGEES